MLHGISSKIEQRWYSDITYSAVVQATTRNRKCFVSLVHNLRGLLLRDGGVWVAPPPELSGNNFPLPKLPKWKCKDSFCLKRNSFHERFLTRWKLINVRFYWTELLLFKSSAGMCATISSWHSEQALLLGLIRVSLRLGTNHIGPFLASHPKVIVASTILSTFVRKKSCFRNWCMKASTRRQMHFGMRLT